MEIITTHLNADFDCIGAMVAALRLHPGASVVFPGSQEKGVREFLRTFTSLDLPVIRLKDLDPSSVTRIVLVDCSHTRRIGRLAEIVAREGVEVEVYDHHPSESCDIHHRTGVIRDAGSTTTILCRILMERGVTVSAAEATVMLLGIHEDTGNFRFSSTTVDDHLAAAWLLEQGGDPVLVSRHLEQLLTPRQLSLLNDLMEHVRTIAAGDLDIAVSAVTADDYPGEIAPLAHMMMEMSHSPAIFLVVGLADRVHVVGRSSVRSVDAGVILNPLGGGGHPFAASATVRDKTHLEVLEVLEESIRDHVVVETRAADIMSHPVKTLSADVTIAQARDALIRYNVNAMPVLDGERMIGLITRRIVERAIYHGITDAPVTEYMHVDFMKATPDTPIGVIRTHIVQHNRRFVPVFDGDRLVGVVTRTDILRADRISDGSYSALGGSPSLKGKSIRGLMEKSLPAEEIDLLRRLGDLADRLDLPLYVVGGFVRDLLLGKPNKDLDLTVEGDGLTFAAAAGREMGFRVRSHEKFRTAVLISPEGRTIDVASTRLEYYESPGALPVVEHSSLKMDLFRRDFTINTLAIAINPPRFGELIDFFGARRDLEEKSIRVLHNLSFVEDPTRMFRAVRLEQRLGFKIVPHTERLIRNAVKLGVASSVGGGRIHAELRQILAGKEAIRSVDRLASFGLLPLIHPQLEKDVGRTGRFASGEDVIAWYRLTFAERSLDCSTVRFLILTHPLSDTQFRETLLRLGFSEQKAGREALFRGRARSTLSRHEPTLTEQSRGSELYRLFGMYEDELLLYLMSVTSHAGARSALIRVVSELKRVKRELTGEDLKRKGIPPGPRFGEILRTLLWARMDGVVKDREGEMELVERLIDARREGNP